MPKIIGFLRNVLNVILVVMLKGIMTFIPKNRSLILFSAWFGQMYADSSRYMFEYLLANKFYNPIWYTINEALYNDLKRKGIPVVYGKSFKGIWTQIRAKMLVSSVQLSDFNFLFYRKCVFFDLDHGYALKQTGFAIPGTNKRGLFFTKLLRTGIQYWLSAGSSFNLEKVVENYSVERSNVVRCNKPRLDVLFDKELQKGKNDIIEKIKKGKRAIVWMPTHRSDGNVPIKVTQLLNLDKLQELCQKENIVFIIKKHFYHKKEKEDLSKYPNIFDVTNEDVDSQVILAQADALVSDYSSSYIEYLILDRPIILYAYDIQQYLESERGLYIPFEQNTAGERVYTSDELLKSIERISHDWYDTEYSEGRNVAKQLYFNDDVLPGHYREEVKKIIDQLMEGSYSPSWD